MATDRMDTNSYRAWQRTRLLAIPPRTRGRSWTYGLPRRTIRICQRLDKPLRFYGIVISHALPFIDKPQCDQLTDYLAASGYNAIRLHCYHFKPGVMKEVGSTEFSPEALDQLDYFFHSLRQRGIYYTVSINNWGFFKAGDVCDVAEFRDRGFRFESNGLLPISEDLQRWFREYSMHLFCHTNRYTGFALKDDPALLSVELTNEDSLFAVLGQHPELVPIYRDRCREELQRSVVREPQDEQVERELPGFILHKQQEFVDAMMRFLRELGVTQPITDLDFRDNLIYALPRSQLDYVDVHHYWALYQKLPEMKPSVEPPIATRGAIRTAQPGEPSSRRRRHGCSASHS